MARKASSKPADSTVNLGFEDTRFNGDSPWSGARQIARGNSQGESGGVHPFGDPPKTTMRGATFQPEGFLRVVSEVKTNKADFTWVQQFIDHLAPQDMGSQK